MILHQDIQSTGTHDSVEDARTALQLFEKHCQLEAEGKWEQTLEEVYVQGGKMVKEKKYQHCSGNFPNAFGLQGWKVAGGTVPVSPRMDPPPLMPFSVRAPPEEIALSIDRIVLGNP